MSHQKIINAVRIYYDKNGTPMADLKSMDGVCVTIQWTDVRQRERFMPYITGYTLIYDERPKREWEQW